MGFILSRVSSPPIDDEGRVTECPIADGFIKPLKGLGVRNSDQNFLAVSLGQFADPGGEKKVVLFHVLGVFIEVLVIPPVF